MRDYNRLPFNLLVCVPKYNSHAASFRLPRFCGAKHKIHTRGCQQPPRATKNPTQQGRNGAENIRRHLASSHYAKQNGILKSSFQERAAYFSDAVKNLVPKEAVHGETKAAVSPDSVTLITPEMTLPQPTEGTPLGRAPLAGRGAGAARRRLPASAAEGRRSPRRYRKRTLKAQRRRLLCGKEGGRHPSGTSSGQGEGRSPGGQRRARCSPPRARAGGRGRAPRPLRPPPPGLAWPLRGQGPAGPGRADPGPTGRPSAPPPGPALPGASAAAGRPPQDVGLRSQPGERPGRGGGGTGSAGGPRAGGLGASPPAARRTPRGAGPQLSAPGPGWALPVRTEPGGRRPPWAAGRAPGLPPPPPGRLSRRVPGGVF